MVTIKLLGGAKKSLSQDVIRFNKDGATVQDVLDFLLDVKPQDTPDLDLNNILIAVNGVDVSGLDGRYSKLKDNDVVTIIPVIHGGEI